MRTRPHLTELLLSRYRPNSSMTDWLIHVDATVDRVRVLSGWQLIRSQTMFDSELLRHHSTYKQPIRTRASGGAQVHNMWCEALQRPLSFTSLFFYYWSDYVRLTEAYCITVTGHKFILRKHWYNVYFVFFIFFFQVNAICFRRDSSIIHVNIIIDTIIITNIISIIIIMIIGCISSSISNMYVNIIIKRQRRTGWSSNKTNDLSLILNWHVVSVKVENGCCAVLCKLMRVYVNGL